MNHRVSIFLVILFASISIQAQDNKLLKESGDKLFKLEHYRKALPFFEQALKTNPDDPDALFKAGVCYLHKYSKEKALEYLLKAYEKDPNIKHIHYWLGRAYHQNYQFDKANQNYEEYKKTLGKADERRYELEKYIKQTAVAQKYVNDPQNFFVKNLGPEVNTIYSEHSPVSTQDDRTLLFTSRRDDVTGGKEDLDGEYFEDIFKTTKGADNKWGKPETIGLNTSGHDASIQLYDNDQKLLLYKFTHGGDIYFTEKEGNNWKEPQKFPVVNTGDFESDAYITPDQKTLYFATNHYKKKGDLDIYYITKNDDGTWSKPKDLPGNINTNEDDDAPFLSPDGKTLYFSSRGHENMGGFDIFKSTLDASGKWSDPVNLGYPVNTTDDDVYFYMAQDGKRGYLSSYREGGYGEKDIYEIIPIPFIQVQGVVTNEADGKPVSDANIIFIPERKSSKGGANTQVANGNYQSKIQSYDNYKVIIISGQDTVHTSVIDIPMSEENAVIVKNFTARVKGKAVDTVAVAKVDTIKPVEKVKPVLEFNTIYFDENSSALKPLAKKELDRIAKILKENPTAIVSIEGHTDAKDDETSNSALSEKRAKKALDYLVIKGVKASQLSSKGFGETVPVAANDTEEGRAKNRRVEFKLVSQ